MSGAVGDTAIEKPADPTRAAGFLIQALRVRYAPVAMKFGIAARRRDGPQKETSSVDRSLLVRRLSCSQPLY
jgi:hypothetical protein